MGYARTADNMDIKWEMILNDLTGRSEFNELSISALSLRNNFRNFMSDVVTKFGITDNTVNLSGLKEIPSDYEQLMIDMYQESFFESRKRQRKAERTKRTQKISNIIAEDGLHLQRRISTDNNLIIATTNTDNLITPSTSSEGEPPRRKQRMNPQEELKSLLSSLTQLASVVNDSNQNDLDKKCKESQIRANEAKERYFALKMEQMMHRNRTFSIDDEDEL